MVKILITDLQTNGTFRAYTEGHLHIQLGKDLLIPLFNTGKNVRISNIKGWLSSDSYLLHYLIDGRGRRYKLQFIPPTPSLIDDSWL